MLADDHVVVRHGLRMLLARRDDIDVVAEAGDGDAALDIALRERPDVLVLDLNMPGRPSLELLAELGRTAPEVAVVVLTMEQDPELARGALDHGAHGYVLKQAVEDELVEAIRVAAGGGDHVSDELRAALARHDAQGSRTDGLTERETEVLRLVALGHTNPEIAAQLEISVRTVETHRTRILQKTDIASRPDLVRYALERQLI